MDSHAVIPPLKKGDCQMTPEIDGMLSSFFRFLSDLMISAAKITRQAEKFAEGQSALGLMIVAITALFMQAPVIAETVWAVIAIGIATFQGIAVLMMDHKSRAKAALMAFCMWTLAIVWFFITHKKFAVGLSLTSAAISWLVYVFCNTSERLVYNNDTTNSEHSHDFGCVDTTRDAVKILHRLSDSETKRKNS